MRRREQRTAAVAALLAAAYNVAVNRVLPPATHVPANLAVAGVLTGVARVAGRATWADLGMDRGQVRPGLRVGVVASTGAVGVVCLCAAAPATRRFFADERVLSASRGAATYETGIRIPFATALPEEVVFRGVLLGVLSRSHHPATAIAWTSGLFGLWHLLPTVDMMRTNPAGDVLPKGWFGHAVAFAGTTAATAAIGAVFAGLRLRGGSVVAPVMAHTAINASAYLAARLVGRAQRQ